MLSREDCIKQIDILIDENLERINELKTNSEKRISSSQLTYLEIVKSGLQGNEIGEFVRSRVQEDYFLCKLRNLPNLELIESIRSYLCE